MDVTKLIAFIKVSHHYVIIIDQSESLGIEKLTFAVIKSCLGFDTRRAWFIPQISNGAHSEQGLQSMW